MTYIFPDNAGLIQDELLGELALTSSSFKPASPATIQALASIVEAVILHEVVYYRPVRTVKSPGSADLDEMSALIDETPLVQELLRAGILRTFPQADVDAALGQSLTNYDWTDFLTDYGWLPHSSLMREISDQAIQYRRLTALLAEYPTIFENKNLTEMDDNGNDVPVEKAAKTLISEGMPIENLIILEGWNHKAAALVSLSRSFGLSLYVADTFVPHQLGLNEQHNTKIRQLYQTILEEAATLGGPDEDVGSTDYATVGMPPLAQLALQSCGGDLTALPDKVLELRRRHARFRHQMTDFERAWRAASARRERIKLQADFTNALQDLIKNETRPRERLIYKIWDIFKKPTAVIEKIGDKIADRGRHEQVVGQMRGLRKFWTDLLDAPVAEHDKRLIASSFTKVADRDVWTAGRDFADAMRRRVGH